MHLWLVCLLLLTGCARPAPDQTELERRFEELLSGATLEGRFSVDGREELSRDTYAISKVSKVSGDTWLFQARVQYGSHDVTVPIPLTVKWAGDTPMITLTDLAIPGLGTYTARVLFHGNRYAGTWSGKTAGGEMFGKIVRSR